MTGPLVRAYLGLGSNVGDRLHNLQSALRQMAEHELTIQTTSSVYETTAIGPPQPDFLNAVCAIDTELTVRDLLSVLKIIEQAMGRVPTDSGGPQLQARTGPSTGPLLPPRPPAERWGPRVIDLDILLFGDETLDYEGLIVPHPELTKRNFAMIPLLEIVSDLELPSGEPLSVYCDPRDPSVQKVSDPPSL